MYVLTIYRLIDDIDIELQKVAQDEQTLKAAALAWAEEGCGWEPDDDDEAGVDEQYEALLAWLDGGESDNPRVLIRKADS
ncbi:MAG: hypothetical protein OHK0022_32440 [Roseiflexaceae bacterium]